MSVINHIGCTEKTLLSKGSLFFTKSCPVRIKEQVCFETKMSDRQTGGEEEGCCLFEGLISFGKEGDGSRLGFGCFKII